MRDWESGETPAPRARPAPVAAPTAPRREKAGGPKPLEHSRATVATFLTITFLGLIGIFLYWYAGTVRSLDRTVVRASQERTANVNRLLKNKFSPSKSLWAKTSAVKDAPRQDAAGADAARTIAPAGLEQGNLVVGIPAAEIGPITVNNRETEAVYLKLAVRVTNLSTKAIPFAGWHHSGKKAMLRDSLHNFFNFIKFSPSELPVGCVEGGMIQPQETIQDMLVFENPTTLLTNLGQPNPGVRLELDLPLGMRIFAFEIPGAFIRRPPRITLPKVAQVPPPAPPTRPTPPPTRKEPTLADLLREDYDRLWTQAVRKSKALSSDSARDYLRRRKQEILTNLAERYNLPRSAIGTLLH